jgi:hypothetical protein
MRNFIINTIIAFLDIIHPVLFKTHDVSETGFCLRLRVLPTQLGPIDQAGLRTLCVLNKNRRMDNVQKHNNCINISSSQIFRSY